MYIYIYIYIYIILIICLFSYTGPRSGAERARRGLWQPTRS